MPVQINERAEEDAAKKSIIEMVTVFFTKVEKKCHK